MADVEDLDPDEALIEEDLDEDLDDELIDDDEIVMEDGAISVDEVIEAEDDAEQDLDEGFGRDDVEASLDEILEQRTGGSDRLEPDEDQTDVMAEVATEPNDSEEAAPRQKGEFVCQSCFLVKKRTQLADSKRKFCLDCV